MNNPLVPKLIVDKNGISRTVHVRANEFDGSPGFRSIDNSPPQASISKLADAPNIDINSILPMAVREKMKDIVFEFAEKDGSDTNITIPRMDLGKQQRWIQNSIRNAIDDVETARYVAIAHTLSDETARDEVNARNNATDAAEDAMGMRFPEGTMQAIYNNGRQIEELTFPNISNEDAGKALKERLQVSITADGVHINDVPAETFWLGYEAYAGMMEDAGLED